MRFVPTLLLLWVALAAPVRAADEGSFADRFPEGATAYIEARNLGQRIDDILASPLAEALKGNPGLEQALSTPDTAQLMLAEAFVRGATGLDFMGLFRALAGREIALAAYGSPQRVVAMARVQPAVAEQILKGAEILSQQPRAELKPADAAGPTLWQIGKAYVCLDGDVLVAGTDLILVATVREHTAGGLAGDARLAEARRAAAGGDVFAFVDLDVHRGPRAARKPKDVGEALLAGVLPHVVGDAPWAALRVDLARAGDGARLAVRAMVPAPAGTPEAVREAFGGTLEPFPFALPEDTIGLVRMRRSLAALWQNRDALVAERAIPKLVEFETNFGNLTGGMDFVEQFLPSLESEMALLVTQRTWPEGAEAPAIRLPQFAFVLPVHASEELATRLQVAFQTAIGIVNATQGMAKKPFMLAAENYRDVLIQSARYLPASAGEIEAAGGLPIRYNLEPTAALVDGNYVLASTPDIVKQLIDGRGGREPAGDGVNAGAWIDPAQARRSLALNREALIAQTMIKEGADRGTAERKIDLALDLGRYLRSVRLTAEETRGAYAVAFEIVAAPAAE